jgi:glycosyltransferase involved in cell wall biosynthesis
MAKQKHIPIKLAIIGTRGYPYVYGGYETFVRELANRLVKQDVEIHIYCQKGLFKERPSKLHGIHLHYIPTVKIQALNQIIHSLFSLFHTCFSKVNVILVLNLAAGPFGWLGRIFGKKMIINTDGLEWKRPKWKGLGSSYFYFGAWCATKFYHQLVSDANAIQEVYLKQFKTNSEVIAYGAPPFVELTPTSLHKFNLSPKSYYLIVGRMIPDNNAHVLINEFLASNSTKKLVVVGDVPYKDEYAHKLKAKASERLIFTGYVNQQEELLSLYQHCFIYLHGHEFGGTNPTMLKAMSNNCAILALDTLFNREMLGNGQFGLFFTKKQGDLAQKIKSLELNTVEIDRLRKIVADGIGEKYDWDKVTDKYLSLFKKVLLK